MRAQFVRGQNPKKTMGIGLLAQKERLIKMLPEIVGNTMALHKQDINALKKSIRNKKTIVSFNNGKLKVINPDLSIFFFTSLKSYLNFWAMDQVQNYRKTPDGAEYDLITNESQNFERGLDPRQAMEIGLKTWDKISPGYILKPKKEVYVSNKGNFAAEYGSADTIWQDMYILILLVQKIWDKELHKEIIYTNYTKCWTLPEAIEKSKGDLDKLGATRMFGTQKQFENRFEIIQRKDESKNS